MIRWLAPLLLAGCATAPPTVVPIPKPIEVLVPVPVSCVSEIPARPALTTDQELAAMPDYAFVLALRRNDLLYRGFVAELEAVLSACRVPGV